jgi:hypothetical protein
MNSHFTRLAISINRRQSSSININQRRYHFSTAHG